MKPGRLQFSTSALLLATTYCAIVLAGSILARPPNAPFYHCLVAMGILSPYWVPIATCAFAFGRNRLTIGMTVAFTVIEAVAIGLSLLLTSPSL